MLLRHAKTHLFPKFDEKTAAEYLRLATQPLDAVFRQLSTSEQGLNTREEAVRLKQYGPNAISHEKPPSWLFLLAKNFTNPFIVLILLMGIVSVFFQQYDAAGIIACMATISVLMRFVQEFRSNHAAERLKALVSTKATVVRQSESVEIDMKRLVPGDIVHLSAGDMVPADVRLISAKGLFVSQAALTGESMPVEKNVHGTSTVALETPNLCFLGTSVLNGTAQAVVLKTGDQTYFGSVVRGVEQRRPLTSFDLGVSRVTWLLIRFIFVLVPCIFLINFVLKGDWFSSLLFSLSVAVSLTPEMLPMIVTANLARGAVKMAKSKVIVKQLNAIQNFGAIDVLCADKTGTITQDKIILEKYLDPDGNESRDVLEYGYLNSHFQTGLKNLLDQAILEHKEILQQAEKYQKVDEIPFDFERRKMSVVLGTNSEHLLIAKGAVEEVAACSDLSSAQREKIFALDKTLSEEGLRVLGVACKKLQPQNEYNPSDETHLTFLGFLAFLDPPKLSAIEAIAGLKSASIEIKILTGDNEIVTKRICQWVNLSAEKLLLGTQIDAMTDAELEQKATDTAVFAKVSPLQKARIIHALKSSGHTVGYLGDGINDAPALRMADVGICVDTSVDVAKESSDIIMLKKNLAFLREGVLAGRETFGNMIKYIKMAFSSNFGNVFTLVGASVIFPFFPMLPVQLLLQNLLYDLSQAAIPFDSVDAEFLRKPRAWDPRGIAKFMLCIGPVSSVFDYATFGVLWFVFGAQEALFQSGWFVEALLSQTLIVHMIRTAKIPFFQSRASWPLLGTTAGIMAVGLWIPYSFVGKSIGLQALPSEYFGWLAGIILGYCLLTQWVKVWFIRKFGYWL